MEHHPVVERAQRNSMPLKATRRFQFGMRTALVFVALSALVMAYVGQVHRQFQQHWEAAAFLEEAEVAFVWTEESNDRPTWHFQPSKLSFFDSITELSSTFAVFRELETGMRE